jgi:putative ABC transport system permease protein
VLHLTLANLRAKPVRFLATFLAIIVGTGFLAGTMVLSDSLGPAVKSNALVALKGVDAAVEPALGVSTLRTRGPNRSLSTTSLPATLLPAVEATSGVQAAAGILTGTIDVIQGSKQVLKHATGSLVVDVPALSPYTFVQGRAPSHHGEVTIDQLSAGNHGWHVGSTLELATASGAHQVQVVGITRYGGEPASSTTGDIVINQADAFSFLAAGAKTYDSIYVQARPGVSQQTVADELQHQLGSRYQVRTGDDLRQQAAGDVAQIASVLGTVLQVFAYVALFVGIFIIYNTFSIVVTQRVREFALLRAVGARGSQLGWAVVLEALVVGIVASVIGMFAGVGLFLLFGKAVPVVSDLVGTGSISLRVQPSRVIEVVIVGTIVTVVSAAIPAFRAARIRPMAALRTAAVDRSGTNHFRAVVGVAAIVLGAVLLLTGMATHSGTISGLMIGAGPVFLFIGVLIGGPVLARAFATAVGAILGRFGMSSRLAVANAKRNPSRTATTANALIIGMFLVVFVTAAGGGLRDWIVSQADQLNGADLSVTTTGGGIPPDLQHQIRTTEGVRASTGLYSQIGEITFGGNSGEGGPGLRDRVSAGTFSEVATVLDAKTEDGDLANLRDDQIAYTDNAFGGRARAGNAGPPVGSPVEVTFKNGVVRTFTVGAIIKQNFDLTGYLISSKAALAADPQLLINKISVDVEPGQLDKVQTRLENETANYSTVTVQPGNVIAQFVKAAFNFIISSVNALLAFAIAMAVFGIVNTLILSVTERTSEIGLLRSVGMSRRQLRTSIRAESVVLAADGTFVGMAFGLFVAWAVTQPLFTGTESFSWPWREMAVIALIGLIIGMVASLVPAWRAARIDMLDAIASE